MLESSCFISAEEQKKRYEQHNNNLENEGYKSFLERFIIPVFDFLKLQNFCPERILDYGSGPSPCLVSLMKQLVFSKNAEIRGWDPYFSPETPFFDAGADLVTCLEVAEHFENPYEDFQKLSSACRNGGFIAVGTYLLNNEIDFSKWWYKDDKTHTSFYTKEALRLLGARVGLDVIHSSERLFIFKKGC